VFPAMCHYHLLTISVFPTYVFTLACFLDVYGRRSIPPLRGWTLLPDRNSSLDVVYDPPQLCPPAPLGLR